MGPPGSGQRSPQTLAARRAGYKGVGHEEPDGRRVLGHKTRLHRLRFALRVPSAPLTSREVATLAELLELLLPSQSGPGAREAGSLDYVLGRLTAAEAEQVGPLRSLLADAAGREEDHLRLLCTADDQWFSRLRHWARSEEHTSELQSLMRISYAVFCLIKKNTQH